MPRYYHDDVRITKFNACLMLGLLFFYSLFWLFN